MLNEHSQKFNDYVLSDDKNPLFLQGDALEVLKQMPDESIDFCMTSPPYWGKRQYSGGGIGLEKDYNEFINNLTTIFAELKRVLKPTGSFWLNIGDTYLNKKQLGIPWRIAITLMDEQGWILRNDIVWNKVKGGMDNSKDKLGNVHEPIFHFVKQAKYYYDVDAIRSNPKEAKVVNGAIVSATGVSGVRYKRQIELSPVLTEEQKRAAFRALDSILQDVMNGKLADFRMVIKGQQRATHSDSTQVSGRAKELQDKGFYFLKYHPNGSKPTDVWDIMPEDTQKRDDNHFAPYPEDLCKIPILATCPENGIALDPFCGTGTTMLVARQFNRKSVGVDVADSYIKVAEERCHFLV